MHARNLSLLLKVLSLVTVLLASACREKLAEPVTRTKDLSAEADALTIESLLPGLEEAGVDPDGMYYAFIVPCPDLDYELTLGRMWMDAQQADLTAQSLSFDLPAVSDHPVEVPLSGHESVIFKGFHWPEGVTDVGNSTVQGSLTLHISLPESSPVERAFLCPGTEFHLPSFLSLGWRDDAEVRMENQSGNWVVFNRSPWEITRSGRDLELEVYAVCPSGWERQDDGTYALSGTWEVRGNVEVRPEDVPAGEMGTRTLPLDVRMTVSDLEFTRVSGTWGASAGVEKSVSVEIPSLQEARLNQFQRAKVETHLTGKDTGFRFQGYFYALTGWEKSPLPDEEFTLSDGPVSHEASLLVQGDAPERLGVALRYVPGDFYLTAGESYRYRLCSTWRIPLLFAGVDWQKTCLTPPVTLSSELEDALPGSDVLIRGWAINGQPFALRCTPVIIDADGKQHEYPEAAFSLKGARMAYNEKTFFDIHWTAEPSPRPVGVCLKLEFGVSADYPLAPQQCIRTGLSFLSKEVDARK